MEPIRFSTSLPVQVLHRAPESSPKAWQTLDTGPGWFTCPAEDWLGIRVRNIDDAFVASLVAEFRTVPNLIMLNLSENRKVTDKGIRALLPLSGLQELHISSCDLSNAGIALLPGLTKLVSLDISYCNRLTGNGLLPIRELPHLEYLNLQGLPRINNGDLARIRRPNLKFVVFNDSP